MLTAGTRLGVFEIRSLLGVGGMGEVYRARDTRLERDVAVKVLPGIVAGDPERRARFQREARLLATLNHPNIAAIYGIEEAASGVWALILELIEGETLAERIARGRVPPVETVSIARQLVDALDAAHERGIIHRDLKPSNIKITAEGSVKVLDFGLAKAVADPGGEGDPTQSPTVTSAGTREGIILGSAAYMSPEQARGRPVDKRADIWAFGCVLFELLAGRPVFDGESISDVLASVLQQEPQWDLLPPQGTSRIQRLIERCLEKDPKSRLRDVADAREYLREIDPMPAAVVPAAAPARRTTRSRVAAVALIAVLAASGAGAAWSRWSRSPPPAFPRVTRIAATSAYEFSPVIAPDGKWIAYLSDVRGPVDLWVKFVAGGEPANLTAALDLNIQRDDNVSGLQISPDGNLIAFPAAGPGRSGRSEISSWVMPVPLGGAPRRVLGGGDESLTWSPDGARIAFVRTGGSAGDSVWIADTDGQHPKELLRPHGGRHTHWLRWSRDGRFVYFNYGPQPLNIEPTQIARVPAAGGALEIVVSSSRRAVFPFPDAANRGLYYAANPDTVDLGLWWRDLSTGRDYRLINGLGDYAAPSVSADGSRMVAAAMTSQQYIARVDDVDLPSPGMTRTTDVLSGDLEPGWSADGTRVVFSSLRGGDRNIWMARGDFSAAMPVTFGTAIDEHPAFSPDGQEIAFVSDRGGTRGVWLVSTDGRPPHLLVEGDVLGSVSWSPDGHDLVYSQATGELPKLAIVARATGQVRPLLVDGAGTGPAWSPRGDVIAYLETLPGAAPRVRFVDVKGQRVESPLASRQGELANGVIAWSPDGRRLASTILLPSGALTLWVLDLNNAARTRQVVELPAGATLQGLTWTRDGRGLTFGLVTKTGDVMLAQRAR